MGKTGFISRPDIVFTEVSGVNYGVILKDDAKRIAPFRIWDQRSLDEQGNPVVGGLYDRHLGPTGEEDMSTCPACQLAGQDCPGHCGHIRLGLPVYSPLFFDHMLKIAKSICFNCFALKIGHEAAERYIVRIKLIGENRVPEAMAISMRDPEKLNRELANLMLNPDGTMPKPPVNVPAELKDANKPKVFWKAMDSIQKKFMEDTVKDIFTECMKQSKCQQCGLVCNKMKQLQKAKVFMQPINEGEILSNKRAFLKGYMRFQGRKEYITESRIRRTEEEMKRDARNPPSEEKKQEGKDSKLGPGLDDDIKRDTKEDIKDEIKAEGQEEQQEWDMIQQPEDESDVEDVFIDQRMTEYFYVSPLEIEYVIKRCWQTEASGKLLRYIYWSQNTRRRNCRALDQRNGYQQFFIYNAIVAPNMFRPIQVMEGQKFAHFHNTNLEAIVHASQEVESGVQQVQQQFLSDDEKSEAVTKLVCRWITLQYAVNQFIDSSTMARPDINGIKQFLEKKEGLFRRNMMGKRTNMCARSTISPDVYISPGEVGIPPMFAEELSIAEGVTEINLNHLQRLVKRGPHRYPGAVGIEDQEGNIINLSSMPPTERQSLAKTLLVDQSSTGTGDGRKGCNKAVFRQLTSGDYMLTNRQPTLHKPSLMCHSIRVLRGERTIRLHYANCGTFNADFDGDEMNLHCPQDHGARAEMRHLMHADHQYIVPTSGGPIRTLIQDHVVSSVWMTSRGRFFNRQDIDQCLFFACSPPKAKISIRFELPPPAIIYPKALWTGKQLIASMVKMMCPGNYPITFMGKAKTSASFWGADKWTPDMKVKRQGKKKKKDKEIVLQAPPPLPTEDKVYFRNGEYMYGCFDKSMYGGFGLVHSTQCIYGNKTAGRLLGACSRLFTHFLQCMGHTTGYQDVILIQKVEDDRKQILTTAETTAIEKSAELVDVPFDAKADWEIQLAIKKVIEKKLRERYLTMPKFPELHDQKISGVMGKISSAVIKACLPEGSQRKFPHNGMAVMTSTGAKGSSVNFSQICCLLGQQELEGRRVPRMASGKTLPCFLPYDAGARSGGFIGDRYLTGLRPQEYYYHCMAGRDGLVDTTVKTASSGYLQRCVIKIMEAMYVAYDYTVRDIDDQSIVLFYYGEDAVDVHKQTAIAKLDLIANNADRIAYSAGLDPDCQFLERNVQRMKRNLAECDLQAPIPNMAERLPTQIGVVSEKFAKNLYNFVEKELPDIRRNRRKKTDTQVVFDPLTDEGFKQLMYTKYMECLMPPGEAVGVLAGQSIGEPSTQMTLNTFHMAGRGEANVTLGIPRLREILMSASENIKTPVMKIPLRKGTTDDSAHELYLTMNRSFLVQYVSNVEVKEWPYYDSASTGQCQKFEILVEYFRPEQMVSDLNFKWEELTKAFKMFCKVVKKKASAMAEQDSAQITSVNLEDSGFEDVGQMPSANDDDAVPKPAKQKEKDTDDGPMDEENEEFIEGKMRFCGGHGEFASYAGPDDDDKAFIKIVDQIDKDIDEDEEEGKSNKKKQFGYGFGGYDEEDEFAIQDDFMAGGGADYLNSNVILVGDGVTFVEDQYASKQTATIIIKEPNQVVIEPIIEEALIATIVRQIPKIEKVYIAKSDGEKPPAMQTDGINFDAILGLSDLIDENGITCNNMIEMERRYGIEAARSTIMSEVSGVFGAYGIDVDPRHLKVISERMTCEGRVRGCNRMAIAYSVSPFLKASFETATKFLIEGALYRVCEPLGNPAANIVVGRGMKMGTGACEVTVPVPENCGLPMLSKEEAAQLGITLEAEGNVYHPDEENDDSMHSDVEKCIAVESEESSSDEEETTNANQQTQQQQRNKQKDV